MPSVRLWNDNVHPYEEKFKGALIKIAAGDYIEMDSDDAHLLMGQFGHGPKKDQHNLPDPKFFKKLRIEGERYPQVEEKLVCHADGSIAATEDELKAKLSQFKHMKIREDDRPVNELAARVDGLESKMDQIISMIGGSQEKKVKVPGKRGRPKKEASKEVDEHEE